MPSNDRNKIERCQNPRPLTHDTHAMYEMRRALYLGEMAECAIIPMYRGRIDKTKPEILATYKDVHDMVDGLPVVPGLHYKEFKVASLNIPIPRAPYVLGADLKKKLINSEWTNLQQENTDND